MDVEEFILEQAREAYYDAKERSEDVDADYLYEVEKDFKQIVTRPHNPAKFITAEDII